MKPKEGISELKERDQAQNLGRNKNEVVNLWDATRNRNP